MPSQRLLKILDPSGHIADRRVLASTSPKALMWATSATRPWMTRALTAAGFVPLVASALRHLRASMHPHSQPTVNLVVAELTGADDDTIATLASARWAGYAGEIWLVASTRPPARVLGLLDARTFAADEALLSAARVHP